MIWSWSVGYSGVYPRSCNTKYSVLKLATWVMNVAGFFPIGSLWVILIDRPIMEVHIWVMWIMPESFGYHILQCRVMGWNKTMHRMWSVFLPSSYWLCSYLVLSRECAWGNVIYSRSMHVMWKMVGGELLRWMPFGMRVCMRLMPFVMRVCMGECDLQ